MRLADELYHADELNIRINCLGRTFEIHGDNAEAELVAFFSAISEFVEAEKKSGKGVSEVIFFVSVNKNYGWANILAWPLTESE